MENAKSKDLSFLIFIPLLFLVFIRPFFSGLTYPALEIYYEYSLIFLAIITIIITRGPSLKNPYNIPVLLLLLAYLASTIASINIQNSIKEVVKFASYVSIFFLVSQGNDNNKKIIIKTIFLSASIISLYSIYQYFWGYQHTLDYLKKINSDFLLTSSYAKDILIAKRAIGTFPSPTILGGYLIIVFFLSLYIAKNNAFGLKWLIPSILIVIVLILSKSMGAWLSFIAGLIVLFLTSYSTLKKRKITLVLSFVFIACVLAFIIITRWERLMNLENPQNSITQRLNYWSTAIAIIKDHPIVGVGPGNFHEVFLNYKAGLSTNTRYAHNILLHQWSETGILGLIGVIYLIIGFFRKCKTKPEYRLVFLAGLVFILHNFIDNSYFIPQAGLMFWILLALI